MTSPWCIAVLSITAFSLLAATAEAKESLVVTTGQRQLFLDDHVVGEMQGLVRTMHQPDKRGAVIEPDQPWETVLQTRCVPAWDVRQQVFKLWLITSTNVPDPAVKGATVGGTSYAESKDGVRWTKPVLRQWDLQGSRENNFINVGPEQLQWPGNAIENVVYDADDPDPSRRYKGFLGAYGRKPMVSPDGVDWRLLDVPQLPSADESNMSYDRAGRMFIATLKTGGPYGRSHAIWTSQDFEKWTNLGVVFHADEKDQRLARLNIEARLADPQLQQPVYNVPDRYNADIYNLGIFRYEGLYVSLPAVYHAVGNRQDIPNTDGFHLIQLATSRDLRTWQRLGDRRTFIGPSPAKGGGYDLTQLLPPSAPVVRGDELWFYYTGIKYRARPENADPKAGAICLAVLRRDGFISLDADEEPGTLLTKPFVVHGTQLSVNVDTPKGALEVAVLDDQGESLAVSQPVVGDQPRAVVEWQSGGLPDLKGQTVSLRFTLREAEFYSFWLDSTE